MGQLLRKRLALRNIQKFDLISWCGKFVERHSFPQSFARTAQNSAETAFPRNFHTRKLGEISIFFALLAKTAKIRSLDLGR